MIEKTVLDSGLVVLSENIPVFPSFSLSFTLRNGSRAETTETNGIHHLIEHMVFKGSKNYNLKQIADISDRLGGQLNAFTSKEITQYYIKAIDEKLNDSFALLTDMVFESTFPQDEYIKERNVAVQEIKESEDSPETFAFETFYEDIYKTNGLGFPIAGKADVVAEFDPDMVFNYYKNQYSPDNFVLAAVGKVEHQKLADMAQNFFKHYPKRSPRAFSFEPPVFYPRSFAKSNRSLKQIYVILGFDSMPIISPLRHRFSILSDIVGGGMSSRLFQKIREEHGLAYTVSSFADSYLDCGLHLIYSVVDKEKVPEYLDAVKQEIVLLKKNGITQDELDRSRDHMKSSVLLSMENSVSRMRFHVNNELNLQREITMEEIVEDINRAGVRDFDEIIANELNLEKTALFLYGDISQKAAKKNSFQS